MAEASKTENQANLRGDVVLETRHPIRAARLLYTAPHWQMRRSIHAISWIMVAGLVYACIGTKDDMVVVPIKLERETVAIESLGNGIVTKVLVNEGQLVDSQKELVYVQQTRVTNVSDEETLKKNAEDLQNKIDQEKEEYEHKKNQIDLSLDQLNDSMKNVVKDRTTLQSQLDQVSNDHRTKSAKLTDAKAALAKQQELYNRKDITKDTYETYRSAVDDLKKAVDDTESEEKRLKTSLDAISEEHIQADRDKMQNERAQNEKRHQNTMDRLEKKKAETDAQLKGAEGLVPGVSRQGLSTIYRSSFSGLITQLQVKPGHIVSAGTPLVSLVKEGSALVAKAMVMNKDIGRLRLRQKVTIRYFAYPPQDYGVQTGRISAISSKPVNPVAPAAAASANTAAPPPGQVSTYAVQVSGIPDTITRLGRTGKGKSLEIGLEGTAEIKVGEKRFIELMFSPLSKWLSHDEGL